MNDPRVEASAKGVWGLWDELDRDGRVEARDRAASVLHAADAADREQGIHRVRVDEATVEQVARIIETNHPFLAMSRHRKLARAILAALTGAES